MNKNIRTYLLAILLCISNFVYAEMISIPSPNTGLFENKDDTITLYRENKDSVAVLIFLTGGTGQLGFKADMQEPKKFLFFKYIADGSNDGAKLDLVFMDSPYVLSPLNVGENNLYPRSENQHLNRIKSVVEFYKNKTHKPVWLLGHSNGAFSVAEFLNQAESNQNLLEGVILASQRDETQIKKASHIPILVIHHIDDACKGSTHSISKKFYENLKLNNTSPTEFLEITGGVDMGGSPCFALHTHHTYEGVYDQFTNGVISFVSANHKQ